MQQMNDRIIRSQRALDTIRAYIHHNPARWSEDRNNPEGESRQASALSHQ